MSVTSDQIAVSRLPRIQPYTALEVGLRVAAGG